MKWLHYVAFAVFSLSALCDDEFKFGPSVDAAVAALDLLQWQSDTEHLSLYNRYHRHPEIDQARDWLVAQFNDLGFATHIEEVFGGSYRGYNVVAEIAGSESPDEIYLVGAHYDAISEIPHHVAPGAEDNASGTAGLLAIARALMLYPPKKTVRLVAFSLEEPGLYGSIAYVEKLVDRGEKDQIGGALIMDMIAYTNDQDLDVLIETSSDNQSLVTLLKTSAQKYSVGRIVSSFNYWGSDHVPFINSGIAAALLIENDYDEYPDYHKSTDVFENLHADMAQAILSMALGALGYWVL